MRRLLLALFVLATAGLQAAEVVFTGYNLENYFISVRSTDYGMHMEAQKPEKAIAA